MRKYVCSCGYIEIDTINRTSLKCPECGGVMEPKGATFTRYDGTCGECAKSGKCGAH